MSEITSTSVTDVTTVGLNRLSCVGAVGDNPSLQISPFKLDGKNYLSWLRPCTLTISVRGLTGYITGDTKELTIDGTLRSQWHSENS